MIVQKFIQWSQVAPASARADGVGALARAYLYSDMSDKERGEAEQALFAMLDDPSPMVRRAMAESFASAAEAPPAIIHGLACDQSDISALVLARSPLLSDEQLIDCAAIGDDAAQAAIALRADLSPAVSSALAEIASREALIALAVNEGAHLPDFAMRRMIERFGSDGEFREALLGRAWLPGSVRARLAEATARQLADFAVARNWMSRARSERLVQDSRDRAAMIIAASCADYSDETAALAAYLRVAGQLTPGLALRALLCGQTGLFEATMVELTGLSPRRVAGLVKDPQSNAFAALYSRAGLPSLLLPAFRAALAALARLEPDPDVEEGALRLPIIDAALKCCLASETLGLEKLVALLRRFETDAAREGGLRELKRMLSAHKAPETLFAGSPVLVDADSADIAAFELPVAGPAQALDHAEALDPADAVALSVDDPAPPFEFAIDLDALEKELIAA